MGTTTFPVRGQKAPNFWNVQLQAYIDEAEADAVAAANQSLASALTGYWTKSEVYDKTTSDGRFATTAQGSKADTALQASALTPYSTTAQMNSATDAVRATGLAVGTNLNTVQTSGNYLGFAGTLALNYPIEGYSGALRVDNFGSGSALQVFTPQSGGAHVLKTIWTRRMISNAWSAWTPNSASRFVTATVGAEAYLYDPTSTAGADRQVQVIQQALGSADLNTITFAGSYIQTTNTLATLALNYPKDTVYGVLDVQRLNSQNVTQTFTTIASAKAVWRRRLDSNVWTAWEQIPLLRLNNPSTQPGLEAFVRNGDTGGDIQLLTTAVDLGSIDLNEVTFAGTYRQGSTSIPTTTLNYPVASTQGFLEVIRLGNDAANILQRWIVFGGSAAGPKITYSRRRINSTWGGWEVTPTVRWADDALGRRAYMWDAVNNREQRVYGDTGWRDITSLLVNGWTATSVTMRRVNDEVEIRAVGLNGSAATTSTPFPLGAGFAGWNGVADAYCLAWVTATKNWRVAMGSNVVVGGWATSDPAVNFTAKFDVMSPWPTANPGTAVTGSTIPIT